MTNEAKGKLMAKKIKCWGILTRGGRRKAEDAPKDMREAIKAEHKAIVAKLVKSNRQRKD